MSKDIAEKRLEWHNDVFVDIFNNVLFEGTEVLKEENLTSIPTQSYVRAADGTVRENDRDIRKVDKEQNVYRLVCGLENQTGRENTMPERVMGYDYAAYEEQIKELEELNRMQNRPAYAQRIHEDQKLAPVVTGVLNWGNEEWKGPMDLHDMIRFPAENEDIIKHLVPNYPMNLIEVRKLPKEVRERLTSDFRLIADYFVGKKDKASLKKLFADQTHKIKHPEEFLDVLSEVASDVQYKELKKILTKEQKEELTMCIIADELVGQGRIEGRQAGLLEGKKMFIKYQENQARRLKTKGISLEDAKEILYDFDVEKLTSIYNENM